MCVCVCVFARTCVCETDDSKQRKTACAAWDSLGGEDKGRREKIHVLGSRRRRRRRKDRLNRFLNCF